MATKPTENRPHPASAVDEVADEVAEAIEEVGELSARIARGTVLGVLG